MRFSNYVSLSWDFVCYLDFLPTPILSIHEQLILTPPGPPVPIPAGPVMETMAPILWPPGMGSHELTDTVYHRHTWIALKDHDLGMCLLHISLPPNDLLTPIDILQSSRKAAFAAGEVKADGKPIACCVMTNLLLPTPMVVCGKMPLPIVGTGSAKFNSLLVGQHWIDWARGAAAVVIRFAIGFSNRGEHMDAAELDALFGNPLGDDNSDTDAAGGVDAAIAFVGQEYFDYHGDSGAERGGYHLERSGTDGTITVSREVNRSIGVAEAHGRGEVRFRPDGHGGWATDGGVSGGYSALGEGRDGSWSTDHGARETPSDAGWNSPLSEGTTLGDFSPL